VLFAEWLASLQGQLDVETLRTYEVTYCGKHWPAHYSTLADMCSRMARERYRTARLKVATAKTVKKETWSQDKFLRWCEERELIPEEMLPRRLRWNKGTLGTRTGRQREHARQLTEVDVVTFLGELPAWREVGGRAVKKKPFPVRDRYLFGYETGFRPATLDGLVWADWVDPSALRVRDEVDKIRFGRIVPLSVPAKNALLRVQFESRERGLPTGPQDAIFGKHRSGKTIAKAAKAAGLDGVAPYDLRHARATHLADAGAPITGIGYLVGHRQATTTNRYLHQSERAARLALGTDNSSGNPVRTANTEEKTGWPTGSDPATSGATRQLPAAGDSVITPDRKPVSGTDAAQNRLGGPDAEVGPDTREAFAEAILGPRGATKPWLYEAACGLVCRRPDVVTGGAS